MYIINVLTNTISVSSDKLDYAVHYTAPIIVGNRLYAFGGGSGSDADRFQYYDLLGIIYNICFMRKIATKKKFIIYHNRPTMSPTTVETTNEPTTSYPTTADPTTESPTTTTDPTSSTPTFNEPTQSNTSNPTESPTTDGPTSDERTKDPQLKVTEAKTDDLTTDTPTIMTKEPINSSEIERIFHQSIQKLYQSIIV